MLWPRRSPQSKSTWPGGEPLNSRRLPTAARSGPRCALCRQTASRRDAGQGSGGIERQEPLPSRLGPDRRPGIGQMSDPLSAGGSCSGPAGLDSQVRPCPDMTAPPRSATVPIRTVGHFGRIGGHTTGVRRFKANGDPPVVTPRELGTLRHPADGEPRPPEGRWGGDRSGPAGSQPHRFHRGDGQL